MKTSFSIALLALVLATTLFSCRRAIDPDGYAERLVDFGNGECNNGIFVTVNGETYTLGTE